MNEIPPVQDKPISNWAVAGGLLVFALLYLIWALGFDALAGWLKGGAVEQVLNWASHAYWWLGLTAFVVFLVCGKLFGGGGAKS